MDFWDWDFSFVWERQFFISILLCAEGSINNLLETLDKDESVRNSIENSIIRIADHSPNEVLQSIYDFRQRQTKLSEVNVSTILRIVEHVTCTKKAQECLNEATIQRISEMCIVELVKMPDVCPMVQKPALESLVALGRKNCDVVMENLMRQMQHGQVTHFMVLHSMGQLATANPMGKQFNQSSLISNSPENIASRRFRFCLPFIFSLAEKAPPRNT